VNIKSFIEWLYVVYILGQLPFVRICGGCNLQTMNIKYVVSKYKVCSKYNVLY
jgi:hypothetical protein